MLRLIFTVLVLCAATVSAQVLEPAEDGLPGLQVNGCGAKNGTKVPDNLLGCKLKMPCDNHDLCYSRCLEGGSDFTAPHCQYMRCKAGGDLTGNSTCRGELFVQLAVKAQERRRVCDLTLLKEIKDSNSHKPLCGAVAGGYHTAVNLGGGGHFNGYEVQELMKAINKLTTDRSVEQLVQLQNQGFEGKLALEKELKLSTINRSSDRANFKGLEREGLLLDQGTRRWQIQQNSGIGPYSGGRSQNAPKGGGGASH